MSEAVNKGVRPGDDEDLKRAVVESLDSLDYEAKLAVLEFSRGLDRGERQPNLRALRLLDEWAEQDPAYDEEVLPELKEALDRDRLGYRKLFE